MLRALVGSVLLTTLACGRIGFDAPPASEAGAVLYRDVRPVYIVGVDMPPLVPTVTGSPSVIGSPSVWTITPAPPTGITFDDATGVIAGTPAVESPATIYTVTADAHTTTLRLRTANGYIVNDGGDTSDANAGDQICETSGGGGLCTLRAAFEEVNAGDGAVSVVYIEPRTIVLGVMLPVLTEDIELVGQSAASTIIDGSGATTLTHFGADDVSLTLSYLTYRNAVGTLYHNFLVNLELVIDHAVIRGCDRLIDLPGTSSLRIRDSLLEGNTGDLIVFAGATVTIERSTFARNTDNVGALLDFVYGDVTIRDSTFSENSGEGSAILLNNASALVVNTTFASNVATVNLAGAIREFSNATGRYANNLFYANIGVSSQCYLNPSTTADAGGNLVFPMDDVGRCRFAGPMLDPRLDPLADNGGPTPTHALQPGSPALDAAVGEWCGETDQRGVARPQGRCDIGAFERE